MNYVGIICYSDEIEWIKGWAKRSEIEREWKLMGTNRRPNIKIYLGLNHFNNTLNTDFILALFSLTFAHPPTHHLPHLSDVLNVGSYIDITCFSFLLHSHMLRAHHCTPNNNNASTTKEKESKKEILYYVCICFVVRSFTEHTHIYSMSMPLFNQCL